MSFSFMLCLAFDSERVVSAQFQKLLSCFWGHVEYVFLIVYVSSVSHWLDFTQTSKTLCGEKRCKLYNL